MEGAEFAGGQLEINARPAGLYDEFKWRKPSPGGRFGPLRCFALLRQAFVAGVAAPIGLTGGWSGAKDIC